jgi:dephospho-CoA kinase
MMVKTYPEDCLIVGIVGRAGAGKDELAEYLSDTCGALHISIGDFVREIADERDVEKTRENLHAITREFYRHEGVDYFIKRIITEIETDIHELVVISGIRAPTDVEILREHYGDKFLLVAVVVNNPYLRYDYIQIREDPHDPQEFEAFLEQDQREETLFRISTTINQADIEITNNTSLVDFYELIRQKLIQRKLLNYCQPKKVSVENEA